MWFRVLLMLAVVFATAAAHAQAPPAAFFEGRSMEDLRALAKNPHNDVLLRRSAATKLVISLADAGDLDAADAAGREFAKNIDPESIKHVTGVRRREVVQRIAIAALACALGGALMSLIGGRGSLARARAAARRIAPEVGVFLAGAGLVGGYLASRYENGSPLPFVWFAVFMLPLLLTMRAWSAVGSPRPGARVARALAAVAATVAVGFLVVEHVNPVYLEGIGL